jgi:hypothetical protein
VIVAPPAPQMDADTDEFRLVFGNRASAVSWNHAPIPAVVSMTKTRRVQDHQSERAASRGCQSWRHA